MSDRIDLSTFPSKKAEALTMLYLQNQDLTGVTPEEILEKYDEAYTRIRSHLKTLKGSGVSILK